MFGLNGEKMNLLFFEIIIYHSGMSEFEIQIRGDEYTGLEFFKSHDLKSHIAEIRRVVCICAPDVWKISFELPMHGGVRERYRVLREGTKWIVTQLSETEKGIVTLSEKRLCELGHLLGMCESINLLRESEPVEKDNT
jgi:hypothetical protein